MLQDKGANINTVICDLGSILGRLCSWVTANWSRSCSSIRLIHSLSVGISNSRYPCTLDSARSLGSKVNKKVQRELNLSCIVFHKLVLAFLHKLFLATKEKDLLRLCKIAGWVLQQPCERHIVQDIQKRC